MASLHFRLENLYKENCKLTQNIVNFFSDFFFPVIQPYSSHSGTLKMTMLVYQDKRLETTRRKNIYCEVCGMYRISFMSFN